MDLIVAFPAMFWGGLWLWRRQPLGYLVATVLLVKGGLLGVTLVVNTWLAATFWAVAPDPAVPVYAIGGLGGLALAVHYLRNLEPCRTVLPKAAPVGAVRDRRVCCSAVRNRSRKPRDYPAPPARTARWQSAQRRHC